ncbi:cupin domain-containing protein [Magnetococcus sp. PR-3]|uniref:cupin domain-containing protein n=1 Tax=Magnetococcus sp. PR-3 TaxID=3120355 RepID=UPI002FCE4019
MKTTSTYWNTLAQSNQHLWQEIPGSQGHLRQLTVAEDPITGDYTRLTWFKAGYETSLYGCKSHAYPEEIFIIAGRLYDHAFDQWLETGHYASRPPGEKHGPFKAEGDVLVLEISFPSQAISE